MYIYNITYGWTNVWHHQHVHIKNAPNSDLRYFRMQLSIKFGLGWCWWYFKPWTHDLIHTQFGYVYIIQLSMTDYLAPCESTKLQLEPNFKMFDGYMPVLKVWCSPQSPGSPQSPRSPDRTQHRLHQGWWLSEGLHLWSRWCHCKSPFFYSYRL